MPAGASNVDLCRNAALFPYDRPYLVLATAEMSR